MGCSSNKQSFLTNETLPRVTLVNSVLNELVKALPCIVVLVFGQIVVEGLVNGFDVGLYRMADAFIGYRSPVSLNTNIFGGITLFQRKRHRNSSITL